MTVEEMDDLAAFPPSVQKWSQNFLFVGAAMLHFWTQTLRSSDFRWSRRVKHAPFPFYLPTCSSFDGICWWVCCDWRLVKWRQIYTVAPVDNSLGRLVLAYALCMPVSMESNDSLVICCISYHSNFALLLCVKHDQNNCN